MKPLIPNCGSSNNPNEYQICDKNVDKSTEKRARMEIMELCEEDIIIDLALLKPINYYDPRIRDEVKRRYVLKGPCQTFSHDFPRSQFGNKWRCFQVNCFKNWQWLEYSVSKDIAFCFWCYDAIA